jgi:hypothetical protein
MGAGLAAGVNATAVGVRAAGKLEAGMATGLDAAADGMSATGEAGETGRRAGLDAVPGGADTTANGGGTAAPAGRTAAAGVDAAADRGPAGGDTTAATTSAEVLGQRTLHELGKWIHDSSPLRRALPERERKDAGSRRRGSPCRRRTGRDLSALASPGKEDRSARVCLGWPSHHWLKRQL